MDRQRLDTYSNSYEFVMRLRKFHGSYLRLFRSNFETMNFSEQHISNTKKYMLTSIFGMQKISVLLTHKAYEVVL